MIFAYSLTSDGDGFLKAPLSLRVLVEEEGEGEGEEFIFGLCGGLSFGL